MPLHAYPCFVDPGIGAASSLGQSEEKVPPQPCAVDFVMRMIMLGVWASYDPALLCDCRRFQFRVGDV